MKIRYKYNKQAPSMNWFKSVLTIVVLIYAHNSIIGQNLKLKPDLDFISVPANSPISTPTGVAVNSKNHVFITNSGPKKLVEYDVNGQYVRELIPGILVNPHGVRVDAQDNIWVTDLELHQVLKISPKGQIKLVLGQKKISGLFDKERKMALFFKPADIAFGSNGNIYVADGYGNSRVVKFDKNGNFIKAWGELGDAEGQFNNPHNIIIDHKERVYVADRNNKRIQVFSSEGNFIKSWTHLGKPWGLSLADDKSIYMTDGTNEVLYKLDLEGKVLGTYGAPGQSAGNFRAIHGVAVGLDGHIYVTEVINWRVAKLKKLE